eukprot:560412-Rhodomonas_salina.3
MGWEYRGGAPRSTPLSVYAKTPLSVYERGVPSPVLTLRVEVPGYLRAVARYLKAIADYVDINDAALGVEKTMAGVLESCVMPMLEVSSLTSLFIPALHPLPPAIYLRACYAMPGTDLAYGAPALPRGASDEKGHRGPPTGSRYPISLRAPTHSPVLT